MAEKEKQILSTFEKVLPEMTELEKEKLLSFGEGIAFAKSRESGQQTTEEKGQQVTA